MFKETGYLYHGTSEINITNEINKEPKFKIGDIVELKSGSFPMVVQNIVEPNEYCKNTTIWTNFSLNGEIRSNGFHPDVLIHVEIKKPWWAR